MITLGLLYRIDEGLSPSSARPVDIAFDASWRHAQSQRYHTIIGFEGAFAVVAGYLLSVRPRCYFPFEIDLGHASFPPVRGMRPH